MTTRGRPKKYPDSAEESTKLVRVPNGLAEALKGCLQWPKSLQEAIANAIASLKGLK